MGTQLEHEAKRTARLRHPHTISVFDFGRTEPEPETETEPEPEPETEPETRPWGRFGSLQVSRVLGRCKAEPSSPSSPRCARLRVAPGGRGFAASLAATSARGWGSCVPNARDHCFGVSPMLRIYPVSLDVARDAAQVASAISVHDSDLARQLRRAAASVPLNIGEGDGSMAGTRWARYVTALGSAREVRACYDVAVALGYGDATPEARDRLDRIVATLFKITRR